MILADWFDPGFKAGGPIQSCKNFVKAFRDMYDLYVITSDRDMGDATPYEGIRANGWLKYAGSVNICYVSADRLHFATIKKLIFTKISGKYAAS